MIVSMDVALAGNMVSISGNTIGLKHEKGCQGERTLTPPGGRLPSDLGRLARFEETDHRLPP